MLERTMTGVIEDFSQKFRGLLLTGQRQVGKTTLLNELAKCMLMPTKAAP